MTQERMKNWLLIIVLTICGAVGFSSCSSNKDNASDKGITMLADKVWMYGQTHPDGFMLDIRTMTESTEGIAVSYAETQNSHSRAQLDMVVRHAVQHDGYVGGWLNSNDGLYYFDNSKLFPENELRRALRNEEIPTLVAEGHADVMITEITEAPYYVQTDNRLAAPLLNEPFNHGEIGVLMQKGQDDLLQMVNATIRQMKSDGTLRQLHEKYGLVYAYD